MALGELCFTSLACAATQHEGTVDLTFVRDEKRRAAIEAWGVAVPIGEKGKYRLLHKSLAEYVVRWPEKLADLPGRK